MLPLFSHVPLLARAVAWAAGGASSSLTKFGCSVAGTWLRTGYRTLQTFGHHTSFRAWRQLLASPSLSPLVQQLPSLAHSYLVPGLAHGLSRPTRLRILHHHYAFWLEHARPGFFNLLTCPRELWHCQVQNQRYSIALSFPVESDIEGQLALRFYVGATCLYTLTFTMVPAGVLPGLADAAVLVSRVQGTRNFALIRGATKHLHECTPAVLLLQALGGLSKACGIFDVVGVGTSAQLYSYKSTHHFDYDQFWQQVGAELMSSPTTWYRMNWLASEKPLTALKAHHRARTARKRLYKQQLRTSVQHYVAHHVLHPGVTPQKLTASSAECAGPMVMQLPACDGTSSC